MPPMPNRDHQAFEGALERWLWRNWAQPGGNRVFHQINVASVGGWDDDYRIPDLVLLTPDRFCIDHNEYFEGPPTVVVEIHSDGDESYEKLDFYGRLGVPEVWILDRDTKRPEMFVMRGGEYERQGPDADGWLVSGATRRSPACRGGREARHADRRSCGDARTRSRGLLALASEHLWCRRPACTKNAGETPAPQDPHAAHAPRDEQGHRQDLPIGCPGWSSVAICSRLRGLITSGPTTLTKSS